MNNLSLTADMIKGSLNWKSVLDILLISVTLFFAYHTLNRLRTVKILFGISLAVVILALAHILDLTGVRWIYSNLSNVALVGFIVVFQPEIRKMFEKVVSLRSARPVGRKRALSLVMAEAAFAMARIKQGALLVLPGKEPVEQWMSGGIALNGDLSLPLLMSIFDHHSPGHDGAATIENGKVTRFAARLPLSESEHLSQSLGTRHHAALGLSEACDALVIAVSEERGSVSTCQNGKHQFIDEQDALQTAIISHWERAASFKPGASKRHSRWAPFMELALGLTLAFLVWSSIIISQGEIIQKGMTVPITYTGLPDDLTLVEDKLNEITLMVGGAKSDVEAIKPASMSVKIDLSHTTRGKHSFQVTQENTKLPKGVKLMGAEPAQLSLRLEQIAEREAELKPQFVGKLPPGVKLVSAQVHPNKVMVRCPANFGGRGEISIKTTPIDLSSIDKDTQLDVQLAAPPECQPAKGDWPAVVVSVDLDAGQQPR